MRDMPTTAEGSPKQKPEVRVNTEDESSAIRMKREVVERYLKREGRVH